MFSAKEGPRERMAEKGVFVLSDEELVAVILSPGTRAWPCGELAKRVIGEVGSIRGLSGRRPGELARIPGMGMAKACRLLAAVEAGRRVMEAPFKKVALNDAAAIATHLAWMRREREELFVALSLNARNRVVGEWVVARGWESGVNLTPRQVFTLLVKEAAWRVVFAHNHPSGDPTPSRQDVEFTRRLLEAGRTLGVKVLDHVIVAEEGSVGMRGSMGGRLDFD